MRESRLFSPLTRRVSSSRKISERAEIHLGDRLVAIAGCSEEGRICCLILVKAEELEKNVKETIGPMLKEVFE